MCPQQRSRVRCQRRLSRGRHTLVCRPMGGRALSIREGGSELKGPESAYLWNSAFTELGQTLTSVFLWKMCWLPPKVPSLSRLLNNSYMKC